MTDLSTPAVEMPEAFQLDSGLPEDMVLTIYTAYFAPHADYMEGKQNMLWLIGVDEKQEPQELRMSIGADWATDDGTIITHPTKKKQHINKNSIYGFWLAYSFQIPELARVLISRSEALGGYGPRDARVWVNLVLQLNARQLKWGRGIDPQERLMPTAYLGEAGAVAQPPQAPVATVPATPPVQPTPAPAPVPTAPPAAVAPPAATPAPTPVAPAQAPAQDPAAIVAAAQAAAAAPPVSNGSPLYGRAIEIAKAAPDFATFLSQAFAVPEILADDELAKQCADESIIFAQAKASA